MATFVNGKFINTLVPLIYERNENGFMVSHEVNIGFIKGILWLSHEEEFSKFNFILKKKKRMITDSSFTW